MLLKDTFIDTPLSEKMYHASVVFKSIFHNDCALIIDWGQFGNYCFFFFFAFDQVKVR